MAATLTQVACAHILHPGRQARREECRRTLPVLDGLPPGREYRVLKIVESDSDTELLEKACDEEPDALVRMGLTEETKSRGIAVGHGLIAASSGSSKGEMFLRGMAIRFVGTDKPASP